MLSKSEVWNLLNQSPKFEDMTCSLRHDRRAEKMFRDAKLVQIYEGTNQINQINLFKRLVNPDDPEIEVFSQHAG